ncbi:Isoaspartyl peptidase/L-asparaginase [Orchesella cincta]|uniref:Isoaspartyl peptidase/L-asparaginase n=1 Tax=Orchesella cincta TaxID=48709 RepID=A0A1D2M8X8_ORCCI|nr:Isoaspartyl peptidase/L-asparaginase [Orchesella cincta]
MLKLALLSFLLVCSQHLVRAADPILIIHGGAGTITSEHAAHKRVGMVDSIRAGFQVLLDSDNPMDAVEAAIHVMENSPAFNAGYGSVLTENGEIEMDAIVINGTDLSAGAVGAMKHVLHPISVARLVMNSTQHVFLVGEFAEKFAESQGVPLVPTSDLIANSTGPGGRKSQLVRKTRSSYDDVGTVGAVAINSKGNIAAATSTGGLTGKMEGRVGDAPLVGAGTLADDDIAGISATGDGEAFIRWRVASRVASLIEQGRNASEAILTVLNGMTEKIPGASGGCIAITKDGEIGFQWNSEHLAWAYVKGTERVIHYGVERGGKTDLCNN